MVGEGNSAEAKWREWRARIASGGRNICDRDLLVSPAPSVLERDTAPLHFAAIDSGPPASPVDFAASRSSPSSDSGSFDVFAPSTSSDPVSFAVFDSGASFDPLEATRTILSVDFRNANFDKCCFASKITGNMKSTPEDLSEIQHFVQKQEEMGPSKVSDLLSALTAGQLDRSTRVIVTNKDMSRSEERWTFAKVQGHVADTRPQVHPVVADVPSEWMPRDVFNVMNTDDFDTYNAVAQSLHDPSWEGRRLIASPRGQNKPQFTLYHQYIFVEEGEVTIRFLKYEKDTLDVMKSGNWKSSQAPKYLFGVPEGKLKLRSRDHGFVPPGSFWFLHAGDKTAMVTLRHVPMKPDCEPPGVFLPMKTSLPIPNPIEYVYGRGGPLGPRPYRESIDHTAKHAEYHIAVSAALAGAIVAKTDIFEASTAATSSSDQHLSRTTPVPLAIRSDWQTKKPDWEQAAAVMTEHLWWDWNFGWEGVTSYQVGYPEETMVEISAEQAADLMEEPVD